MNFRQKGTLTACVLITLLPGHIYIQRYVGFRLTTVHVSDSDVRFCDGPGMGVKKTTKQV